MSGPTAADFSFFEVHPDMIVGIDREGTIVYVNPTMSVALDIDRSEAVGQSIAEFVHPDDFGKALESVAGLSGTDNLGVAVTPIIFRVRRSDGDYVPIECNGTLVGAGPFADWMIIVGRYPGDQLIEQRIGEMLTSGVDLPEIISVIPEFGLWRHPDQHYAISYRTDSGTVWTGSEAAVAIGRAHGGTETPWARASAAGSRIDAENGDLPSDVRKSAGQFGVERCVALPVVDPLLGDRAVVVAWSNTGGPELWVHHHSVEQMARALSLVLHWRLYLTRLVAQNKLAALGRITAGLAHEVRNPLNFIKNFAEIAEGAVALATESLAEGDSEELESCLEEIGSSLAFVQNHVKRIESLVQSLIGQTQGEAGFMQRVNLVELVKAAADLGYQGFRAAGHSGFSAVFHFDADEVPADVYPQELSRLVLNLVSNACSAMSDKRETDGSSYTPTITFGFSDSAEVVSITVRDNGPGIPIEARDRIFDPFYTTKSIGEGTGLGLSLCRDIVSLHGGELLLDSTVGEYCQFNIVLPVRD
jgi:PAS domain S-box-containing protein